VHAAGRIQPAEDQGHAGPHGQPFRIGVGDLEGVPPAAVEVDHRVDERRRRGEGQPVDGVRGHRAGHLGQPRGAHLAGRAAAVADPGRGQVHEPADVTPGAGEAELPAFAARARRAGRAVGFGPPRRFGDELPAPGQVAGVRDRGPGGELRVHVPDGGARHRPAHERSGPLGHRGVGGDQDHVIRGLQAGLPESGRGRLPDQRRILLVPEALLPHLGRRAGGGAPAVQDLGRQRHLRDHMRDRLAVPDPRARSREHERGGYVPAGPFVGRAGLAGPHVAQDGDPALGGGAAQGRDPGPGRSGQVRREASPAEAQRGVDRGRVGLVQVGRRRRGEVQVGRPRSPPIRLPSRFLPRPFLPRPFLPSPSLLPHRPLAPPLSCWPQHPQRGTGRFHAHRGAVLVERGGNPRSPAAA
jgi:hypothetical protein